jgi:hypothetical protein
MPLLKLCRSLTEIFSGQKYCFSIQKYCSSLTLDNSARKVDDNATLHLENSDPGSEQAVYKDNNA